MERMPRLEQWIEAKLRVWGRIIEDTIRLEEADYDIPLVKEEAAL
jgi:hypothetical protein